MDENETEVVELLFARGRFCFVCGGQKMCDVDLVCWECEKRELGDVMVAIWDIQGER